MPNAFFYPLYAPRRRLANTYIQLLGSGHQPTCVLDVPGKEWFRLLIRNSGRVCWTLRSSVGHLSFIRTRVGQERRPPLMSFEFETRSSRESSRLTTASIFPHQISPFLAWFRQGNRRPTCADVKRSFASSSHKVYLEILKHVDGQFHDALRSSRSCIRTRSFQ
ncbi:hypothetical protein ARMSODRAFT_768836 [Armillaria solidipes]|uniref:Uncharacterized protein n=1 Tax=Armillaria solidipes TaxID=1076256 RepID=A0A2H3B9P7_9AGAR|nr:hypothetical protein ARMSODRAFT_768836 [Armillaria solidipes]